MGLPPKGGSDVEIVYTGLYLRVNRATSNIEYNQVEPIARSEVVFPFSRRIQVGARAVSRPARGPAQCINSQYRGVPA